jgi:hypothetical protein
MLGHKGWANRIDPEAPGEMLRIKSAIGLLGLEGPIVEQSCRHQDEAQRSALNKLRGRGGNARLVLEVDPSHAYANQASIGSRARKRMNGFKPSGRKKVCDGGSDAPGCTNDKGPGGPLEAAQEE